MGGVIFLDTSFIVAFFNEDDTLHQDAQTLIKNTLTRDPLIRFYLTDYIFDELITLLKIRNVPKGSIREIGDKLLHSKLWKIIKLTEKDFEMTWKLVKKYSDKAWSFTDISSFHIMSSYSIPFYLSYDQHFAEYPKIKKWGV
jgi:uncharacterized protein